MQLSNSKFLSPTTIADQAVVIGRGLRRLRKDPDKLFARFGFRVRNAPNASLRLPAITMAEVWNLAEQDSGVDFRRSAAHSLDTSLYHLLTPLLIRSQHVEHLLQTLANYSAVISAAAVLRLHVDEHLIGIEIVEDRPRKSPAACDLMRFYITDMVARLCKDPALLVSVDFNCDQCDVDAPLWERFAVIARYNQSGNTLWFNRALANKGNLESTSGVGRLENFVVDYLNGLTQQLPTTLRVRALLEEADLAADNLSPQSVGSALAISGRSLQRHLKSEGVTLRDELHHSRCLRSHRLLADSTLSFTEIAHAVGCTDAAHFTHSQHVWTGLTPTGYRDSLKGA